MKQKRGSLTYYQLQFSLGTVTQRTAKHKGSEDRRDERCHSRNSVRSTSSWYRPCSKQSQHSCVSLSQDTHNQNSQHILVGSTLRRPHATEYSPLDYQSMPDVGKIPKQPFRPTSACTVYTYADRPVSAKETPTHLGRHTKSSLLRCKSASTASLNSISSASTNKPSSSHSYSNTNKHLCQIRDDYRFFKGEPAPKQETHEREMIKIPPHGETMHSFLTGARYNRARYLDSRTLSKLGVYIVKPDLHTFFIKDDFEDLHRRDQSVSADSSEVLPPEKEKDSRRFTTRGANTDPHYLSIDNWCSAEWKTARKPCKEPRVQSAPLRIKPIKAYYYDYETK